MASRTECGTGSFKESDALSGYALGTPYVILELDITPFLAGKEATLKTALRVQELSGFDTEGQPAYTRRVEDRSFGVGARGEAIVPVLLLDRRQREAFGVHEILLRLRARALGQGPPATYGAISVVADVPGAEVLLDGGSVGRTSEGSPTVLTNVLTGHREIRVRDPSGREARQRVLVEKAATAEVRLEVLRPPSSNSRAGLVQLGKNPQGGEEYWRLKDGVIVVRIPAGEFLMGSPEGEGEPHERPQHRVYVSEFLIDKTEVTWRQFRKFAGSTATPLPPSPHWGTPDDYPVSNVRWEEARAYCEWVGGRLPTEAEWEKAARGADGRRYPWGNDWDPNRCNSFVGGPHRPMGAGAYPNCLSPYGVLDMSGSLWEWCADWYGEGYYAESSSRDPAGPPSGLARVMRGADWVSQRSWVRTAYRHRREPSARDAVHGFRCVEKAPE